MTHSIAATPSVKSTFDQAAFDRAFDAAVEICVRNAMEEVRALNRRSVEEIVAAREAERASSINYCIHLDS